MAILKSILISNFKSFKRVDIDDLDKFNAITGPSHAGKTNFLEAIRFVLGEENMSAIRIKRWNDLIHRASTGKPISPMTSVTAVFELTPGGSKKTFTRQVLRGNVGYKINNENVTAQEYLDALRAIGISINAATQYTKFEHAVDSIALNGPKACAEFFEDISGCGSLKEEYNTVKNENNIAENEFAKNTHKKNNILGERMKLNDLSLLAKQGITYYLFKLYHRDEDFLQSLKQEIQRMEQDVLEIENKKIEIEQTLPNLKEVRKQAFEELQNIEREIGELEIKMFTDNPSYVDGKESIDYYQKKFDSTVKALEEARLANEVGKKNIQELEKQLSEVEDLQASVNTNTADLTDSQIAEYVRLKAQSQMEAAKELAELDSISRDQQEIEDQLHDELRLRSDLEMKIEQKKREKEEAKKRFDKLSVLLNATVEEFKEQSRLYQELEDKVENSHERVEKSRKEYDIVSEQLSDAEVDKHDDNRHKYKQEVIAILKGAFFGVYDRMKNVCHPISNRYNVAVAKVFGENMEAIIVDTNATADLCIKYLKDHCLDPETFLPLDSLKAAPLQKKLRRIRQPESVKLLYDVLKFDEEINTAVLFVTNNVLVCETSEDAYQMIENFHDVDVVALNGTFFEKSGYMSTSNAALTREAEQFDENHVGRSQLKITNEKLINELPEAMKQLEIRSELDVAGTRLQGLFERVKTAKTDYECSQTQIQNFERELNELDIELERNGRRIEEIKDRMQERNPHIQRLQEKITGVKNVVFADFCRRIGILNIEQYEENMLRMQKLSEFEYERDRIQNLLDYSHHHLVNTRDKIIRFESANDLAVNQLNIVQKNNRNQIDRYEKCMTVLGRLKASEFTKTRDIDMIEERICEIEHNVDNLVKEIRTKKDLIAKYELEIEVRKAERPNILKESLINGIEIPLLEDSISLIDIFDDDDGSLNETRLDSIGIDYSGLPDNLKNDEFVQFHPDVLKLREVLPDFENISSRKIQCEENLKKIDKIFLESKKRMLGRRKALQKIKAKIVDKILPLLNGISNVIDGVFKSLVGCQTAEAALQFSDKDPLSEPIVPLFKTNGILRKIEELSNSEKKIASLALFFSYLRSHPNEVLLFDEFDYYFDIKMCDLIGNFFTSSREQIFVCSLNSDFAANADAIIGVTSKENASKIIRMKL